jgi:hypothetical protein
LLTARAWGTVTFGGWGSSSGYGELTSPAGLITWDLSVDSTVAYFNEVDRGGHFAAWEEHELLMQASSRRGSNDEYVPTTIVKSAGPHADYSQKPSKSAHVTSAG